MAVLSEVDEAALCARVRARDVAAFEELVRRYQRRIYALCLRMLDGATGDAEDVVLHAFLTAWRRLPVEGDAAFLLVLHRIATRRCLGVLRHRRPASAAGSAAVSPALARTVGRLPAQQRACWLLRETEGLSNAEIAQVVGMTEAAVRGSIIRARAQLAAGLREVGQPVR